MFNSVSMWFHNPRIETFAGVTANKLTNILSQKTAIDHKGNMVEKKKKTHQWFLRQPTLLISPITSKTEELRMGKGKTEMELWNGFLCKKSKITLII